jgi:uncharacterized membrane protein
LTFEFLFLLGKTTELRLSHLNVVLLILAVIVVILSRAKVNLIRTIVFYIVATFLNYSVSEDVDKVDEFETLGSTVTSTDSRHLKNP